MNETPPTASTKHNLDPPLDLAQTALNHTLSDETPATPVSPPRPPLLHNPILLIGNMLNILVLLGSVLVIAALSFETFADPPGRYYPFYLKLQLWVCLIFLTDYLFRFAVSPHKGRYLWRNLIFLLVSIPYLNIAYHLQLDLTRDVYYLLRLIPLIRGGYGLAIMVSWITSSKVTNLLVSYIITLMSLIYFSTLVFFLVEHGPNPAVSSYGKAVWWAFMNVTTVGANIFAVTPMGQLLTVMLASAGMMMFPIFTVYITHRFQTRIYRKERTAPQGSEGHDR